MKYEHATSGATAKKMALNVSSPLKYLPPGSKIQAVGKAAGEEAGGSAVESAGEAAGEAAEAEHATGVSAYTVSTLFYHDEHSLCLRARTL